MCCFPRDLPCPSGPGKIQGLSAASLNASATNGPTIKPHARPSRWLFGPAVDLLLGCGIGYIAIFAVLTLFGDQLRAVVPASLAPMLLLFIGGPHYGATLMRAYQSSEDRRRHVFVGIVVTAGIWLAFAVGVHVALVASILITVYITWSPWHYSGQNFGIALMFLHRRGVEVSPLARRLLHSSFVLSFGLAILPMHGVAPNLDYQPTSLQFDAAGFVPLGIPTAVATWAFVLLGSVYLGVLLAATVSLRRSAGCWKDLVPSGLLVFTQSLWFVVPLVGERLFGTVEALSSGYAFMWIALGHMVQYLWITTYFARRGSGPGPKLTYYLSALAAGSAIWFIPAALFAPALFGRLPYDEGLGMLVAAAVNIHHFVLDGAIWKLRAAPVAQVLLADAKEAPGHAVPVRPGFAGGLGPALKGAIALVGVLSVAGLYLIAFEVEHGLRGGLERRDLARVETSLERLRWLGRDSVTNRLAAAELQASDGDPISAIRNVEDILRGDEGHFDAWLAVGRFQAQAGNLDRAIAASNRALRLQPSSIVASSQLGHELALAALTQPSRVEGALAFARKLVVTSGGEHALSLRTLALAQEAAGLLTEARVSAQLAVDFAESETQRILIGDQLSALLL